MGTAKARSCRTPVQGRRDSKEEARDSRIPSAPHPAGSAARTKERFAPNAEEIEQEPYLCAWYCIWHWLGRGLRRVKGAQSGCEHRRAEGHG